MRSVSSVALQLLRMIEETLQRGATHNVVGRTRSEIALYVLNHKRAHLYDLEHRFQIAVTIVADDAISGQLPFVIEKGEQVHTLEQARALAAQATALPVAVAEVAEVEQPVEETESEESEDDEMVDVDVAELGEPAEAAEGRAEDGEAGRRRRRRRRRGRRGEIREEGLGVAGGLEGEAARAEPHFSHDQPPSPVPAAQDESIAAEGAAGGDMDADLGGEDLEAAGAATADHGNGDGQRRRRRGRRGGRRQRREEGDIGISPPEDGVAPIDQEIAHAVADFGGPPVERERDHRRHKGDHVAADRSDRPHHGEAPQPEPAHAVASEPVAPPKSESPRRRSTVREPAPFLVGGAAPAPQPAAAIDASVAEVEPAAQLPAATTKPAAPRRAGWWAKRMLGDKG